MNATASNKLDRVVAEARHAAALREQGYRALALKIYPWICGRCGRDFTRANLRELTVHHRDHNHDNNPSDGSNWELLWIARRHASWRKRSRAQRLRTSQPATRSANGLGSALTEPRW